MKKIPMMRKKVPMAQPKEVAMEEYLKNYSSNSEAKQFLEIYNNEKSIIMANNNQVFAFDPSEETIIDISAKKIKNALNLINNNNLKNDTLKMIAGQANFWEGRYLNACGLYYNYSNWANVLKKVI